MIASIDTGRATSGQFDLVARPYVLVGRAPLVYCHSGAGSAYEALVNPFASMIGITKELVDGDGFAVAAPTTGAAFGNETHRDRIRAAVTLARTHGATADPPIFCCTSMGTAGAMNFAVHPDEESVACIVGFIPAFDLQHARDEDWPGSNARANIDAAWGVTYPAALPAGADPASNTTALADLPIQLWYANNDLWAETIIPFGAATGAELHDLGALGHTDAAIAAVDVDAVREFIRVNTQ